ncbi:MAG: hypothetical protein IPJ67_01700 [Candidatus Moraniibacteriota bacterium]|nr:MAG: hypothetical protein IPJ67_01700 [Candidatus Moranbacteria bacterium]
MNVKKVIAVLFMVLAWCLSDVAYSETITVKQGDTPSDLAAKYCGGAKNWKQLWSGDARKLPVGEVIALPKECGTTRHEEEPSLTPTVEGKSGARVFKHPGAKPLCPTFKKDPESCREVFDKALAQNGFEEKERAAIVKRIVTGDTTDAARPNGYIWDRFISGKGDVWGTTEIGVPGGNVAIKVCPPIGKKQVDVVVACGNLGINTVIVPEPVVPKQSEVVQSPPQRGCKLDWLLMGQYARGRDMRNVSGKGQATCQFQIDEHWSDGPLVTGGISRYHGGSWAEPSWFVGLGNRVQGRGVWGVDQVELDTSLAYATTRGGDGMDVRKPPISGLDFLLNINVKKYFPLSGEKDDDRKKGAASADNTPVSAEDISFSFISGDPKEQAVISDRVLAEFSLYGTFPLTHKSGPVYWRDRIVDSDSRHRVLGASARLGWELEGVNFVPEVEFGIWNTSGIQHPWGVEGTVGVATRDRFFRVHAGIGSVLGATDGVYGVVKAEINGGGKWLFESSKKSVNALTVGATDSRIALGLDAQPNPSITTSREINLKKAVEVPKGDVPRMAVSNPIQKAQQEIAPSSGFNNKSGATTRVATKGNASVSTAPISAQATPWENSWNG